MIYVNLRNHSHSSVPQNGDMRKSPLRSSSHRIWNNTVKLPKNFYSPPRVSFGWSVLVKGLYQRVLDAGKWKQKYKSGPKPRSGSGGKRLDSSTGGPPLRSTQEYCSPAPAGGLPTGSNCRSQSEFPKDTTKECWGGQTGGRDPVDAFEYFYVALRDLAWFHGQYFR